MGVLNIDRLTGTWPILSEKWFVCWGAGNLSGKQAKPASSGVGARGGQGLSLSVVNVLSFLILMDVSHWAVTLAVVLAST